MLGNLVGAVITLALAMLQGVSGIGNTLLWSTAVVYAFLAAGFGYFQFVKPQQHAD